MYSPAQSEAGTSPLNGTGSTDEDDDPLAISWSLIAVSAGSTATLSGTEVVNPTLTSDEAGSYVAALVVNDSKVDSPISTVTVGTSPPVLKNTALVEDKLFGASSITVSKTGTTLPRRVPDAPVCP